MAKGNRRETDNYPTIEDFKEMWKDRVELSQRKITLGTGKGGVVLNWETTQEYLTGKKPTKEEIQRYSDTLLDGYYVIKPTEISGPTFSDEERPDGQYVSMRWARENKQKEKIGVQYLSESWSDGHGVIQKHLTKGEYKKLTDDKLPINS